MCAEQGETKRQKTGAKRAQKTLCMHNTDSKMKKSLKLRMKRILPFFSVLILTH